MAGIEAKSLDSPDETRSFPNGKADIVTVGGTTVGRGVFEPGWHWTENMRELAGTESCQAHHTGYVLSGRMAIRMEDGTEGEVGSGDVFELRPGHDAWTVGAEPCVMVDWTGMTTYAKPS